MKRETWDVRTGGDTRDREEARIGPGSKLVIIFRVSIGDDEFSNPEMTKLGWQECLHSKGGGAACRLFCTYTDYARL